MRRAASAVLAVGSAADRWQPAPSSATRRPPAPSGELSHWGHDRPLPHRAQPDRPAAHRDRPDRALQLPVRPPPRRHVHPAPRGHRRRALHLELERDILDGLHWLGLEWDEGPEVAGLPARGPYGPYRQMQRLDSYREAAERLLSAGPGLRVLLLDRGAGRRPRRAGGRRPAAPLRRAVRAPHPGAARPAPRRGPQAGHPLPGGGGGRRVRRHRPRVTSPSTRSRSAATWSSCARTARRSTTSRWSWTTRRWPSGTSSGARTTCPTRPSTCCCSGRSARDIPAFAHLPLILNPDRTKMSKRKSQTAVDAYRAEGFIPRGLRQLPGAAGLVVGHGRRHSPKGGILPKVPGGFMVKSWMSRSLGDFTTASA